MDTKDQVKQYISIVDVASMYVSLKPAGKYLKGLCPFHNEKTPSFFVMPEKNSFACYGCNRFGDIFSLVQEMENLGFPEAVNFLIERFQVPVERSAVRHSHRDTDEYFTINEMARDFFSDQLHNSTEGEKARQYLQQRGIEPSTLQAFSIGYAPNSWDGLLRHLREKEVPEKKALELGLLIKNDDKPPYDRFRGRIIFPILSEFGKVVAFGGRTLFEDRAKYLNSPDTPVYKKSNHLYGFYQAKSAVREQDRIVVVEGYFDVISMVQHGFPATVASLGTALTDQQIHLLKRFTDNIVLFYDSDRAGLEASLSAIQRMFQNNASASVVKTERGKDPDECLKREGKEGIEAAIGQAVDGFHFILDRVSDNHDLQQPRDKRNAITEVKQYIDAMDDGLFRDEYSQIAADYFRVDAQEFQSNRGPQNTEGPAPLLIRPDEETFLRNVLLHPEIISEIRALFSEDLMGVLISKNIVQSVFSIYQDDNHLDFAALAEKLSDSERGLLTRIHASLPETGLTRDQAEQEIMACILSFNNTLNKMKIAEINRQIRVAERDEDYATIEKLMNLKGQYVRKKRNQV